MLTTASPFALRTLQDSLWAAEDIDAVFDADPQRVCILQGPVAVKYCTRTDEPIKELLGGIESRLAQKLLDRYYGGDESKVPRVDYIGAKQPVISPAPLSGVKVSSESGKTVYQFGEASSLPSVDAWLETLAGPKVGWLRALLASVNFVQGTSYITNPMRRLFTPRPNQRVVVTSSGDEPSSVVFYGGARSFGPHPADFKAVELTFDASSNVISLTMFEERGGSSIPLYFSFQYRPDMGFAPIHERVESRNKSIKQFYWKLWFGDNEELPELGLHETFKGPETVLKAEDIERFCSIVGNQNKAFRSGEAPMDFAIVAGWQVSTDFPFSRLPFSS
jgi:fatty acid synthase subunit alpha